ncbi:hypothetical protein NDS46_31675 (plasmid) [Paenibacillus thiaminolyticus]|uniref:hypothetical protein n=1 Tax=Paenibacillus thiaminolyticus TaxID=49283 RepID=UPI00232EFDF1|nr:hypothetical protein [Paenibacillus thiaminolyticus]WCF11519.1 hypothetical protein NDS46_31675 [Paenibacillus thiaminolyticus]
MSVGAFLLQFFLQPEVIVFIVFLYFGRIIYLHKDENEKINEKGDEKVFRFKLPIGDWSGDGHGRCDYYLIKSSKPVEQVREIHFNIPEKMGINIEEICSEYGDCKVEARIIDKLIDLGFDLDLLEDTYQKGEDAYFSSEDMCQLWIFLLMKTDLSLRLELIEESNIEMLPFYGFDSKQRHIGFVGYGIFAK